jgi:hypothetical protein
MNKLKTLIFALLTLSSFTSFTQTKKNPPMKNVKDFKVSVGRSKSTGRSETAIAKYTLAR